MKIAIIGGAGEVGQFVTRQLIEDGCDYLTIVDNNTRESERLLETLPKFRTTVRFRSIDINDSERLQKVIKKHDLVVSTLGPFYRVEKYLASISIECGVDYISICDDYDGYYDILDLDEIAKKKGVFLLSGIGWTPGVSNLLCMYATHKLDSIEKIELNFCISLGDLFSISIIKHLIYIFSGYVPGFVNGHVKMVKAATEPERIVFPGGMEICRVYTVGHPETITLPEHIKTLKSIQVKGGVSPDWVNLLLVLLARLHAIRTPVQVDFASHIGKRLLEFLRSSRYGGVSGMRVDISGKKRGKDRFLSFGTCDSLIKITGCALTTSIKMYKKGKIKRSCGVNPPEAVIDPVEFLRLLTKRGIKLYTGSLLDREFVPDV